MNLLMRHLSGECRCARRYEIKTPLRYRLRKSSTEYTAESENMSESGVFFLFGIDLKVGAIVDLVVEMPIALRGTPLQWLYTGHVVRVEHNNSLNRIGIQFDCYEILPSDEFPANLIPNFCIPRAVN
jgi:PilZ domain-containing protein